MVFLWFSDGLLVIWDCFRGFSCGSYGFSFLFSFLGGLTKIGLLGIFFGFLKQIQSGSPVCHKPQLGTVPFFGKTKIGAALGLFYLRQLLVAALLSLCQL